MPEMITHWSSACRDYTEIQGVSEAFRGPVSFHGSLTSNFTFKNTGYYHSACDAYVYCMLQREFIYCYLYVVMLLKSLHCSGGQPIILPSSPDVSQPLAQHTATTPSSELHADDDTDDVNETASG